MFTTQSNSKRNNNNTAITANTNVNSIINYDTWYHHHGNNKQNDMNATDALSNEAQVIVEPESYTFESSTTAANTNNATNLPITQQPHHVLAFTREGLPIRVPIEAIAATTPVYSSEEYATALRRARRRRHHSFVGGMTGLVVGTALLGPFGIFLGYLAGSSVGVSAAIAGERRKDRRLLQTAEDRKRFVD